MQTSDHGSGREHNALRSQRRSSPLEGHRADRRRSSRPARARRSRTPSMSAPSSPCHVSQTIVSPPSGWNVHVGRPLRESTMPSRAPVCSMRAKSPSATPPRSPASPRALFSRHRTGGAGRLRTLAGDFDFARRVVTMDESLTATRSRVLGYRRAVELSTPGVVHDVVHLSAAPPRAIDVVWRSVLPTSGELRSARRRLHGKALAIGGLLGTSYWLLVASDFDLLVRLGAAAVLVLALVAVATSIMHDANHEAFSRHRWINRTLAYTSDALGASSWL